MEIIDGYTHCGLSKYEPIERVREVMESAGVARAVLVQHLGEFDNGYLARIAGADSERFAAVCLVDHTRTDCIETLRRWAATGSIRGVRLTTEVLTARPELFAAAAELDLVVVLYAPDGIVASAKHVRASLEQRPQTRLVITHLGNPKPTDGPGFNAYDEVFALARFPNVYFQLSGMKMFCPWPHRELYPLIDKAAEHFGTSRLYWGSNYPVVGDAGDYHRDLDLLLGGLLPLPREAIADVAGGNALRLWFR